MYDSVTKFLIETFSTDYATWLLGRPSALSKLDPTDLSLEPIRADAIIFLEGEDIILHVETQTSPDQDIFFRLLDYRVRLYRRAPKKIVRQVVIYLKPSQSQFVYQTSFEIPGTRHEFEVLRLWEQPVENFLGSPGLLPLAVLAKTTDREQTLRQVAQEIEAIGNKQLQSNVAASSAIIGGLVLDKELIKQILRRDIMKESPMYQEILDEGRQEGIELVANNLLSIGMSPEQIAKATGLTIDRVKQLQKNN